MNRRGDWMQMMNLILFVVLLILAIILLSLDKNRLKSEREIFPQDLADQEANVMLISLLRTATPEGTLADTIILRKQGEEEIGKQIAEMMPSEEHYELYVEWENTTLYVKNYKLRDDEKTLTQIAETYKRTGLGEGVAQLPTGIKLKIFLAEEVFIPTHNAVHGVAVPAEVEIDTGNWNVDEQHIDTQGWLTKYFGWLSALGTD